MSEGTFTEKGLGREVSGCCRICGREVQGCSVDDDSPATKYCSYHYFWSLWVSAMSFDKKIGLRHIYLM
jgi:hypothetical protein